MIFLTLFLTVAVVWDLLPGKTKPLEKNYVAMGSPLTVKLYGKVGQDTADRIYEEVTVLENRISRKISSSPISELNRSGTLHADREFASLLSEMQQLCRMTDGTFDISTGALTSLWDIGGANEKIPTDDEIMQALSVTGIDKMQIYNNTVTVPDGMQLDMGAVGKGMACDAAYRVLRENANCTGAVISSGGSVLLYGKNPKGGNWTVGIRDPQGGETDLIAALSLAEGFVSTSGNYEKYFIRDGKRYCHILSPFDGQPADSGLASVTVIADSGKLSDALSTACFLLGYEKSLPVLEKFGAQAIFITENGDIFPTDGAKAWLTAV